MHRVASPTGLFGLVLSVLLLATACETPIEGEGAVAERLRGADFSVPASAAESTSGAPRAAAPGTAGPVQPQAQLFFGSDPVAGIDRGAERPEGEGVRLNFDGASLREVVDVVLGEVLGANYTIDPAVDGTVILATTDRLSESELLTVLETILQMHGATLVDLGGSYAVLAGAPVVGASQITPVGGEAPPPLIIGTGVTIVPLRFVNASAAAQFIQPLVSLPEQIRVDDQRNLLLFVGNAAERQNVVRTLAEIDVDWMAGRSVGIFPLQTATPASVIPELEGLFTPLDPFAVQASGVRFLPMDRLNAVLAITSQPSQLVEIERWVQRLDRGSGSNVQFFVYQLQHKPAADLAAVLNETFGEGQGDVTGSLEPTGAAPLASLEQGFEEGDPAAALAAGSPSLPQPAQRGLLDNVKVVADTLANALLIRATPQAYALIERTIKRLDRAPLQVLIEATIAEVALNDTLRYGVQYYFDSGSFRGGFNTTTGGNADGTIDGTSGNALAPLARVPGFNFIFTPGNSNITIDALARITDVQVLSAPSLVVQDNSEATLTVGDEVPLITRTAQGIQDPDAPIVANIEYRDTGVILQVKPRINTNNVVSLEISQEVSRVQGVVDRADENPIIAQRRIASTVNVTSGQTVVLGGLIQDTTTRGKDKIPLLGDIPVLGNAFSSTNNTSQRTELIVFITPRVIRNADDARDISEEIRSRMRSAQPSGEAPPPALPDPMDPAPTPSTPTPPPPPPSVEPRPLTPGNAGEVGPANPEAAGGVTEGPADGITVEPLPPPEPTSDSGQDTLANPAVDAAPDGAPSAELRLVGIGFEDGDEPRPRARPIPGDFIPPAPRPGRLDGQAL